MKKTKTILALASALALLMAACADPTLDPAPGLGNFNDARTNTAYTNNLATGNTCFPSIQAVSGSNLDATSAAPNARLVRIDFGGAITAANSETPKKTIDIMDEAKITDAVKFLGVKYAAPGTDYNTYTELLYAAERVESGVFYAELPDLTSYNEVQPYINGSKYLISGKPIDTNGNDAPGEDPYDNYYYNTSDSSLYPSALTIDNTSATGTNNNSPDFPIQAFSLTGGISQTATGIEVGTGNYDYDGAKLAEYILLEKWDGTKWVDAGIKGTAAGKVYSFAISTTAVLEKYRVVAVDLYKFESNAKGPFKHRFNTYPGIGGVVKATDGKKPLYVTEFVDGAYWSTHDIGGNNYNLFTNPKVSTSMYGNKNVQIILDVDTSKGYLLGAGASPSTIKLVYKTTNSDGYDKYHTIPIASAAFRVTPGTDKNASPLNQQLVITLDPGYVWVKDKTVEIYANSGVTFGTVVLGDEKGSTSVNFNGDNKWGKYGSIPADTATGGVEYDD
jgi:hypothetical protein